MNWNRIGYMGSVITPIYLSFQLMHSCIKKLGQKPVLVGTFILIKTTDKRYYDVKSIVSKSDVESKINDCSRNTSTFPAVLSHFIRDLKLQTRVWVAWVSNLEGGRRQMGTRYDI